MKHLAGIMIELSATWMMIMTRAVEKKVNNLDHFHGRHSYCPHSTNAYFYIEKHRKKFKILFAPSSFVLRVLGKTSFCFTRTPFT